MEGIILYTGVEGSTNTSKTPEGHRRSKDWKRLERWAGPGAKGSTHLLPTPTPVEASALLCEDTCSLDSQLGC